MRFANFISAYFCGKQLHYRKALRAKIFEGLKSRDWDIVHVEGPLMAGLLPLDFPLPKVVSVHDSWALRCKEMLQCSHNLREKSYYTILRYMQPRYERLVYTRYERCVVVANPDKRALERTAPHCNISVISNGTDTEYYRPLAVEKSEKTLVFHGHLGYAPNVEAAIECAHEILPRIRRVIPDAALHLVGADPAPAVQRLASGKGIKVSANLADLRKAVCAGQIYVGPILHGNGIKNKILEAMAMQMPIVVYPAAVTGIDCIDGKHLLIARNRAEFAAHTIKLMQTPAYADQLARAGRALVEQHYSWEARGQAYEELYRQVIEEWQVRQRISPGSIHPPNESQVAGSLSASSVPRMTSTANGIPR